MTRRQVILFIAMSADGYIAKEDGDISFLSQVESPGEDYGYGEFIKSVDTVIMGRKTYEKVISLGRDFPHRDKKCFVMSHSKMGNDENVEFYNERVDQLILEVRKSKGMNIFIDGGGSTCF